MQTAVDYLQEHFKTLIEEDKKGIYKLLFEQAKEMEKQMIIDAHYEGASDETGSYMPQYLSIDDSITYYNDTYGSKGSDELSKVEENTSFDTSSQTEISDEEIEKWAEKYGFRVPYDGSNNFYDNEAVKHYINGAKMYREQLKNKQ